MLGSRSNSPADDELAGTSMRVCNRTTVCRATRMDDTSISFQLFSPVCCYTAAEQLRDSTSTGEESYGTTFILLGKIPRIYLSKNGVSSRISTAKFSIISNTTRTLKSPMRMNKKMVPLSEIGFFLAVCRHGNCCFLILESHSRFRKALLARLSLAPVSKRQMPGSSC